MYVCSHMAPLFYNVAMCYNNIALNQYFLLTRGTAVPFARHELVLCGLWHPPICLPWP